MNKTWIVFVVEEEEQDFIQLIRIVPLDPSDDSSHFMSVSLLVKQLIDDDVRSDATIIQSGEGVDSTATLERIVVDEAIDEKRTGIVVVFEKTHDGVDAVSRYSVVVFRHASHKVEETIGGFFRTSEFHRHQQIIYRNRRKPFDFGNGTINRVVGRKRRKRRCLDWPYW